MDDGQGPSEPPPLLSSPTPHPARTPLARATPEEETPAPRRWRRAVFNPESDDEPDMLPAGLKDTNVRPATPEPTRLAPSVDVPTHDSSDWPQHMVDANRYMTEDPKIRGNGDVERKRNWGDAWLACLREFIEFQRRTGFLDTGPCFPPSTNIRPPEIAAWMKNGRRWKDMELVDHEKFGRQWWAWWLSLQPSSRNGDEPALPTVDMDWSQLRKPGKNGFLLLMISLVWWGKASNARGGWLSAVVEVTNVLRCLQVGPGMTINSDTPTSNPLRGSSAANAVSGTKSKRKRGADGAKAGGSSKKKSRVR